MDPYNVSQVSRIDWVSLAKAKELRHWISTTLLWVLDEGTWISIDRRIYVNVRVRYSTV